MSDLPEPKTPEDFPQDYGTGAVGGVQPKLLARKVGDRYVSGLTEEERYARYDNCFDMVLQLERYCLRKLQERPQWTATELLAKVRVTVDTKAEWDFSVGEVDWMMQRLAERLQSSAKSSPSGGQGQGVGQ